MDSKRLRVMKAVTAQLETITVANGYQHDLAGKVFRGRPDFGEETNKPFIGLFEVRPEDLPLRADENVQKDAWIIGVQGVVTADKIHPTDPAHNLLADIKKAIGAVQRDSPMNRNPHYMFDQEVADLKIDGGITFVPVENQALAVCVVKLTLDIAEDSENPYA